MWRHDAIPSENGRLGSSGIARNLVIGGFGERKAELFHITLLGVHNL